MELQITWGRVFRIWISFLWRNLIATLLGMIIAMMFGVVAGIVGAIIGLPPELITAMMLPAGFIIGLGITIIPIRLILGKDFGEFRLVLVANQQAWAGQELAQPISPHVPQ
jgi:uncharacterized membrane protein